MATKKHFSKNEEPKKKTLKGKKKWIKPALSGKKGIVSKFAEKKGIIKAGKDLTLSSIRKVEKVATGKMKKRAIMAETLIGFNKKRFGAEGMNVEYAKGSTIKGEYELIENWLVSSGREYDDWNWNGNTLTLIKYEDDSREKITKEELIEEGVFSKYAKGSTIARYEPFWNDLKIVDEKTGEIYREKYENKGDADSFNHYWNLAKEQALDELKKEGKLSDKYAKGSTITTNEGVIESFLSDKKELKVGNLSTHYSTIGNVVLLRNYGTLIAKRKGKTVSISTKKYSVTTSKIQNMIERMANSMGLKVEKIGEDEFAHGGEMYGYGGEVEGTYGRSKNPATIFVYKQGRRNWYVAEGSVNVNCTYDDIEDGVDIEELNDVDTFTARHPINSVEDLEMFMDDEEYANGGAMYKRGRTVAGSKHVSATKGYRLPHGYKAVKGADKSYNYSRGHKGVKVDAGWRLPKGYEVVEGAYNMKYESGGKFMKGGIAGDIYSLQNPEQFKQLITIYNDLSAQTNLIKNYYLDHTDNSMVFLTAPNVSDIGKDNIYRYVESLRSKGFSIINFKKTIDTDKYENGLSWGNEKGSMIEQSGKEGRANAQWFKLFLIDTIKYESGATLADCWSCKLDSNEKEFACSVYNRMVSDGNSFCSENDLKDRSKEKLMSAIQVNLKHFSAEGRKLATSIIEKLK